MTGYEEFVNRPEIEEGKKSILFELEVDEYIDDLIDFTRDFLEIRGFKFTGTMDYKAVFNDKYIFSGAVQEDNKLAIRLTEI